MAHGAACRCCAEAHALLRALVEFWDDGNPVYPDSLLSLQVRDLLQQWPDDEDRTTPP